MHSSISSFERAIPARPWRRLAWVAASLTLVMVVAWEVRVRAWGYRPTLNDTSDLWADWRERVQPDSIVIIGDSRALFDMDLDALEQGLGKRPVQLALVGSCAYPILENLANDESFHGTVISSIIPLMWLAPPPSPPYQNSLTALKRYHARTVAQRAGHHLGMFLEERIAFLKDDDLKLEELLKQVNLPERASFHAPPKFPPYFSTTARDRRTRMTESAAQPGPLQERVKSGWLPLFTPPPPPSYVPADAFAKGMGAAIEQRFKDTATAVKKIQARGGKVVFVRFPVSGGLKPHEDKLTPRQGPWDRIIRESGAPGIYFTDYPELATFECPEWSHLSGPDSVEFTKRLVPHLRTALAK
ncbi:MAG: hypothetical protein JWQ62_2548 [Lacunisphaera sp.]|nr:hypothetical protein [Lacunisphaera sp.]